MNVARGEGGNISLAKCPGSCGSTMTNFEKKALLMQCYSQRGFNFHCHDLARPMPNPRRSPALGFSAAKP